METIIAFAAGYLLSWPSLVALFLLGTLAEHNDSRGWAVFFALVVATIAYFFFDLTLTQVGIGAACYLIVGIFWSFWRYRRHLATKVRDLKAMQDSHDTAYISRAIARYSPANMSGTIAAWVIIWPLSFVGNMTGDFIDFVQTFVTRFFKGVYHRIYSLAVADLERNG